MPRPRLQWGDWNAVCDVCGFRFKASEMKKRWDNLMVCEQDYELRNPQDLIRVRGDRPAVPWARPETDAQNIPACYLWDVSGYAGLAVTGCAQAGNVFPVNPFTSTQLYDLKNPPLPS